MYIRVWLFTLSNILSTDCINNCNGILLHIFRYISSSELFVTFVFSISFEHIGSKLFMNRDVAMQGISNSVIIGSYFICDLNIAMECK